MLRRTTRNALPVFLLVALVVIACSCCGSSRASRIDLPADIVDKIEQKLFAGYGYRAKVLWAERSDWSEADDENPAKKRYRYCVVILVDDDIENDDSGYWAVYYTEGRTIYSPYYFGGGSTARSWDREDRDRWVEIGCTAPEKIPGNPFK